MWSLSTLWQVIYSLMLSTEQYRCHTYCFTKVMYYFSIRSVKPHSAHGSARRSARRFSKLPPSLRYECCIMFGDITRSVEQPVSSSLHSHCRPCGQGLTTTWLRQDHQLSTETHLNKCIIIFYSNAPICSSLSMAVRTEHASPLLLFFFCLPQRHKDEKASDKVCDHLNRNLISFEDNNFLIT